MNQKNTSISYLIRERGLKKKYVAKRMNIRPETLSRKLKRPETFDAGEMAVLSELLQTQLDNLDFGVHFFTSKLELNSSNDKK